MPTVLDRASGPTESVYALGYSEAEFRRLELQGAFFRDLTQDVLQRAGIKAGMRVLDVGCGEIEIETLAERLRHETAAHDACIMLPPLVGAWTRRSKTHGSPSNV